MEEFCWLGSFEKPSKQIDIFFLYQCILGFVTNQSIPLIDDNDKLLACFIINNIQNIRKRITLRRYDIRIYLLQFLNDIFFNIRNRCGGDYCRLRRYWCPSSYWCMTAVLFYRYKFHCLEQPEKHCCPDLRIFPYDGVYSLSLLL